MHRIRLFLIAELFAVLAPPAIAAQDNRPVPAWTFTVGAGVGDNSTGSIESAMIAGGYALHECFFFCVDYPYSRGISTGWVAAMRRRLGGVMHLGVTVATARGGTTWGKHESGVFDTNSVAVRPSVTTAGLLLGINTVNDMFWVAAGPAYYRVKLAGQGALMNGEVASGSHVGALIATGFRYPSNREAGFAELRSEYRVVGTVPMSALAVRAHGSTAAGEIPASGIKFDHWVLSVALGVRIGGKRR